MGQPDFGLLTWRGCPGDVEAVVGDAVVGVEDDGGDVAGGGQRRRRRGVAEPRYRKDHP